MLHLTDFQIILIVSVIIIAGLIVFLKLFSMRITELKEETEKLKKEAADNLLKYAPLEKFPFEKVVVVNFIKDINQVDPNFTTGIGTVYNYKSIRKTAPYYPIKLAFKKGEEPTSNTECLYLIVKPETGRSYLERTRV